MEDKIHERIDLPDRSYSAVVKKSIREKASRIGFKDSALGEIDIIVSELVSNAVKYASEKCCFLCKQIGYGETTGIEIIYLDDGPGMKDPKQMVRAGISSSSDSLGQGLGAIFRLSDFFDMYSQPDNGTVILSRKYLQRQMDGQQTAEVTIGLVGVPMPGQIHCGDNWHLIKDGNTYNILLSDGLGHGINASEASEKAVKTFKQNYSSPIKERLIKMHRDLKKTRGVVCWICSADPVEGKIKYCGVGNISAKVVAENRVSNCNSYNGIVGYTLPGTIHESETSWNDSSLLVAHSDGINTRWNLSDYPGLKLHHPALIAALLYKNHNRGRDDVVIFVLKRHRESYYPFNFMFDHEQKNPSI